MKKTPKNVDLQKLKNNKFCEAFSNHNKPFKRAVAVKEIINLKYKMDKIIPHT